MSARTRQTPAQERVTAQIVSVALSQPHRRGSEDPRLDGALWPFVARLRLRQELYEAGVAYGHVSRRGKAALGVLVPGLAAEPSAEEMSDADRAKASRAAVASYRDAIYVLRCIGLQAFYAAEELCYWERHLGQAYEGFGKRALSALALHFGFLPVDVYAPIGGQ